MKNLYVILGIKTKKKKNSESFLILRPTPSQGPSSFNPKQDKKNLIGNTFKNEEDVLTSLIIVKNFQILYK